MYGLILHDDLESFCEQQHFVMAQYAKLNHSLIASYVVFGFFAGDLDLRFGSIQRKYYGSVVKCFPLSHQFHSSAISQNS